MSNRRMSLGPVSSNTVNLRGNSVLQAPAAKRMSVASAAYPSVNPIGAMNAAASRRMSVGATALPPPVRKESVAIGASR